MNTFHDFKNAIGKKFKISWPGHSGILSAHDVIVKVNEEDETVEGKFLIVHYSHCRFIQEQPAQLKHSL